MLPAYAGMIPVDAIFPKAESGAPRVCGDDPRQARAQMKDAECSPRMRG